MDFFVYCIPRNDQVGYSKLEEWKYYIVDLKTKKGRIVSSITKEVIDNSYICNADLIYQNFPNSNFCDAEVITWVETGKQLYDDINPPSIFSFYKQSGIFDNSIILPLKWMEYCRMVYEKFLNINVSDCEVGKRYQKIYKSLKNIDCVGLVVDGLVRHPKYSFYTSTGRVIAGKFLSYSPEEKKKITSRFKNDGMLVELDFKSFNIHMIAKILKIQLPAEDMHRFMCELYYGKVTDELYAKSKPKTFSLLYSNQENIYNLDFIDKIKEFKNNIYMKYEEYGYIKTLFGRKLSFDEVTDVQLILRYYQSLEIEICWYYINLIQQKLEKCKSVLCLYVYDAFLIDLHKDDFAVLKDEILPKIDMPYRLKRGNTYGDLV